MRCLSTTPGTGRTSRVSTCTRSPGWSTGIPLRLAHRIGTPKRPLSGGDGRQGRLPQDAPGLQPGEDAPHHGGGDSNPGRRSTRPACPCPTKLDKIKNLHIEVPVGGVEEGPNSGTSGSRPQQDLGLPQHCQRRLLLRGERARGEAVLPWPRSHGASPSAKRTSRRRVAFLSSEVVDRKGTLLPEERRMAKQLSISRKQLHTGEPRASHSTHADRVAKHTP